MKIIALSDIHQWIPKWKDLIKECDKVKPQAVIIAGDLFPKVKFGEQMNFMPHIKKYCNQIKEMGIDVYLILGNDDNQNLIPYMLDGHKDGYWHYPDCAKDLIGDMEIIGYPFVKDYPFRYKYWCRGEFKDDPQLSDLQLGQPMTLDDKHSPVEITSYADFINNTFNTYDKLNELTTQIKDINKSIWMIHGPPYGVGLDYAASVGLVGSNAVLKFIKEKQPMLCIHGHIHESPHYTDKWYAKIDNTICIQAGQTGHELFYVVVEIDNYKVSKLTHSIFGEWILP